MTESDAMVTMLSNLTIGGTRAWSDGLFFQSLQFIQLQNAASHLF